MGVFVLTETSSGYALLKAKSSKILSQTAAELNEAVSKPGGVGGLLKLKHVDAFPDSRSALAEATSIAEGKVSPRLREFLNVVKDEESGKLVVADSKLAKSLAKLDGLSLTPTATVDVTDILRFVREHFPTLVSSNITPETLHNRNRALSIAMDRSKLKYTADRVDVFVTQAIGILDDTDKEINTYAMRVKEWYGWHFPEMAKVINDNTAFAKVIIVMGNRRNAKSTDLEEVLPAEIAVAIKKAAEMSMGTELLDDDLNEIKLLAEQVIMMTESRKTLGQYLHSRMQALAPNFTAVVGELVGARLLAHQGSLLGLAKLPASTIQILGAEKALFRALKTKHDTPKYGLIYYSSLIGQASKQNKGKIARMVGAKATLGLRVDTLSDWGIAGEMLHPDPSDEDKVTLGIKMRSAIERRLAGLEGKPIRTGGMIFGPSAQQPSKFELKEARKYNADTDGLVKAIVSEDARIEDDVVDVDGKFTSNIDQMDVDEESDEDSDEESPAKVNGSSANGHSEKKTKSDKKAQKQAKKAEKEAKRAAKAAKKAAAESDGDSHKKRKRHAEAEDDDKSSKKSKKKSK